VREMVKNGLIWKIGNDNSVNIWGDEWVPLPYMYKVFSPPFVLSEEARVNQLINQETQWWDMPLLNNIFSP
jgi:hypothetical protein